MTIIGTHATQNEAIVALKELGYGQGKNGVSAFQEQVNATLKKELGTKLKPEQLLPTNGALDQRTMDAAYGIAAYKEASDIRRNITRDIEEAKPGQMNPAARADSERLIESGNARGERMLLQSVQTDINDFSAFAVPFQKAQPDEHFLSEHPGLTFGQVNPEHLDRAKQLLADAGPMHSPEAGAASQILPGATTGPRKLGV